LPYTAGSIKMRVGSSVVDITKMVQKAVAPTPLAEWAFGETAAPFLSTAGDLPLSSVGTTAVTRIAAPWGYAASFPGASHLSLAAANVGRLNIGLTSNLVTVAAWVYATDTNAGFVGGCWQEDDADPRRAYGLFYDLATYGGNDSVCMHVSKLGGASPNLPYSRDYSCSLELITRGQWHFYVGTYDGAQAISYLDGKGSSYKNYTEPAAPTGEGKTYDKNPYLFSLGLNNKPCDFTVGGVTMSAGIGNYMTGRVSKLRVWGTALTPQQVQALYLTEKALLV